ncbi:MAG: D-2-hydroxyacid dehydrogenase [Armatimonadetes bacterium]|nr:D-2-hydroxyacid dehydrogenase [Armatimonadota bacterium]
MAAARIVVLDGHAANPGDLSWSALEALGELTVWERTPADLTVARAAGAQVVLTNKVLLNRTEVAALPDLRYVGVLATGYNVVDLNATRERGVVVTNVPAYSTASVVQVTFALLLELTHRVGHHDDLVHQGRWVSSPDFSFFDQPLVELDGLTLGIIGLGGIGQAVARVAQALGMNVIAATRTPRQVPGVELVALEALAARADVISLHCPLTAENTGLVDAAFLARTKPTAYLINTARGPLLNEADVAAALNDGRLAGVGVDVLSTEPPLADNPLLSCRNCVITPHYAWASVAARRRLLAVAADNVAAFLAGAPKNVVNGV